MHIAIVVGETSGDLLGSRLLVELKKIWPQARYEGIGGPEMQAQGFHSLIPMAELSVMGLFEVLKHYPRLRRCRFTLEEHFICHPPLFYIGIDAPDFNLGLESVLRKRGIPTIHYVSPSVWAWRQYRLTKIAKACDLMLTLFPFETECYQQHHIPVTFVGHPLADEIPLQVDKLSLRQQLNLSPNRPIIALLPGSRVQEIRQLGTIFWETAAWLLKHHADLQFLIPAANIQLEVLIRQQIANRPGPFILLKGQSREAMGAADMVLAASGTATLEALLLKRPLVVAYRFNTFTYHLAKPWVHVPYFSLPNLLAQAPLVAEFLQDEVTPENLGKAMLPFLENSGQIHDLVGQFDLIHRQLRQNASVQAAQAIHALWVERSQAEQSQSL